MAEAAAGGQDKAPVLIPTGHHSGKPEVKLTKDVIVVGVGPGAHLRLDSHKVSHFHALIVRNAKEVYVRDLGSRNGTFVNKQKFEGREKTLHGGDLVHFADWGFHFRRKSSRGLLPDPVRTPPATLSGVGSERYDILRRTFVIGKKTGCELELEGEDVGAVHAVIFAKDGRHWIRDFGQGLGTLVNGKPVHQQALEEGDEIEIAGTRLTYRVTAKARAAAPAPVEEEDAGAAVAVAGEDDDGLRELARAARTLGRPDESSAPIPLDVEEEGVGAVETPAEAPRSSAAALNEALESSSAPIPMDVEDEDAGAARAEEEPVAPAPVARDEVLERSIAPIPLDADDELTTPTVGATINEGAVGASQEDDLNAALEDVLGVTADESPSPQPAGEGRTSGLTELGAETTDSPLPRPVEDVVLDVVAEEKAAGKAAVDVPLGRDEDLRGVGRDVEDLVADALLEKEGAAEVDVAPVVARAGEDAGSEIADLKDESVGGATVNLAGDSGGAAEVDEGPGRAGAATVNMESPGDVTTTTTSPVEEVGEDFGAAAVTPEVAPVEGRDERELDDLLADMELEEKAGDDTAGSPGAPQAADDVDPRGMDEGAAIVGMADDARDEEAVASGEAEAVTGVASEDVGAEESAIGLAGDEGPVSATGEADAVEAIAAGAEEASEETGVRLDLVEEGGDVLEEVAPVADAPEADDEAIRGDVGPAVEGRAAAPAVDDELEEFAPEGDAPQADDDAVRGDVESVVEARAATPVIDDELEEDIGDVLMEEPAAVVGPAGAVGVTMNLGADTVVADDAAGEVLEPAATEAPAGEASGDEAGIVEMDGAEATDVAPGGEDASPTVAAEVERDAVVPAEDNDVIAGQPGTATISAELPGAVDAGHVEAGEAAILEMDGAVGDDEAAADEGAVALGANESDARSDAGAAAGAGAIALEPVVEPEGVGATVAADVSGADAVRNNVPDEAADALGVGEEAMGVAVPSAEGVGAEVNDGAIEEALGLAGDTVPVDLEDVAPTIDEAIEEQTLEEAASGHAVPEGVGPVIEADVSAVEPEGDAEATGGAIGHSAAEESGVLLGDEPVETAAAEEGAHFSGTITGGVGEAIADGPSTGGDAGGTVADASAEVEALTTTSTTPVVETPVSLTTTTTPAIGDMGATVAPPEPAAAPEQPEPAGGMPLPAGPSFFGGGVLAGDVNAPADDFDSIMSYLGEPPKGVPIKTTKAPAPAAPGAPITAAGGAPAGVRQLSWDEVARAVKETLGEEAVAEVMGRPPTAVGGAVGAVESSVTPPTAPRAGGKPPVDDALSTPEELGVRFIPLEEPKAPQVKPPPPPMQGRGPGGARGARVEIPPYRREGARGGRGATGMEAMTAAPVRIGDVFSEVQWKGEVSGDPFGQAMPAEPIGPVGPQPQQHGGAAAGTAPAPVADQPQAATAGQGQAEEKGKKKKSRWKFW